jgi:L-fucose isomerase-like protein
VVVDLSEIIAAARGMGGPRVDDRIAEIRDYGTIPEGIPEENVERAAALSLAIEDWVEENRVDATAIQCWSSIQENYGCATCLSMSLMGQKGKPSACETDVTGALTMYALQLATGQPSGYMDWNNNYDEERSKCILTHCSNYPKDFVQAAVEISNLDILGQSIGPERCFGAIKARVAAGPVTFAKISTDDVWGIVKAYTGEARFTDDPAQTPGGIAVCEVPGLQELLHYMCTNGFEHHVAMNRGHVADVLEEAFGTYMGWDVYRHRA